MVFTLNLDSRITYLHHQQFQSYKQIHKKIIYTDKSSTRVKKGGCNTALNYLSLNKRYFLKVFFSFQLNFKLCIYKLSWTITPLLFIPNFDISCVIVGVIWLVADHPPAESITDTDTHPISDIGDTMVTLDFSCINTLRKMKTQVVN